MAAGVPALVMELVEGDDLSQVIARGPIPLADAVPITLVQHWNPEAKR